MVSILRIFALIVLIAGWMVTGRLFAQAQSNPSAEVVSCSNLLAQLNTAHPKNVAKVLQCKTNNNQLHAQIEFLSGGDAFTASTTWKSCVEDKALFVCPDGVDDKYSHPKISNLIAVDPKTSAFANWYVACPKLPAVYTHPITGWKCNSDTTVPRAFITFGYSDMNDLTVSARTSVGTDNTVTLQYWAECKTCPSIGGVMMDGGVGSLSLAADGSAISKSLGRISETTNYNLTVNGKIGSTNTKTLTANIVTPLPVVTLNSNKILVNQGEKVTLSWTIKNANSGTLTPGNKPVSGNSGQIQPTPFPIGSTNKNKVYQLSATNVGGTTSAKVVVKQKLVDLEVDISAAKLTLDGVEVKTLELDSSYKPISVGGIRVLNTGNIDLTREGAELLVGEQVMTVGTLGALSWTQEVPLPLPAGASVTLPKVTMDGAFIRSVDQENGAFSALARSGTSSAPLTVTVDPRDSLDSSPIGAGIIIEINESNNQKSSAKNVVSWAGVVVVVVDASAPDKPLPNVKVRFQPNNNGESRESRTNNQGEIALSLTDAPTQDLKYTITSSFEGEEWVFPDKVAVTDFQLSRVTLSLSIKKGPIVRPLPTIVKEFSPTSYPAEYDLLMGGDISSGFVVAEGGGQRYRVEIKDNKAKFLDLPKSVTELEIIKAEFDVYLALRPGANSVVHYIWERNGQGQVKLGVGDKPLDLPVSLPIECFTQLQTVRICVNDDKEALSTAKSTYLPVIQEALKKLTVNFEPQVRLTSIKEVWVVPHMFGTGRFSSTVPEYLWVSGRYSTLSNLLARDLITHEAMHALDFQLGNISLSTEFWASSTLTGSGDETTGLTSSTGDWAWKNVGYACAFMGGDDLKNCIGHSDPADGPQEIFAEQMTSLCIGLPVKEALQNVAEVWRNNPVRDGSGNALPQPRDLELHKEVIASRSIGSAFGLGNVIYGFTKNKGALTKQNDTIGMLATNCTRL